MIIQYSLFSKTIFVVAICGIIIALIGNYILSNAHNELYKNTDNNVIDCDQLINKQQLLQKKQTAISGHNALVIGYSITAFSIFSTILLAVKYSNNNALGRTTPTLVGGNFFNKSKTNIFNGIQILLKIINSILPSISVIGVITYVIILTIIYKENLILGRVSNDYYFWSGISSIFILFQIILLLVFIFNKIENKLTNVHYAIYALSTITIIILGIENIILASFSTDG
uniref:Uncharacterized protein n=1 Tax=viral metagenome TaxID=1070528 RepID=A0A6C0AZ34_9ZZZZ|tara:strand:+ start:7130 stop:7813 length:684 start_codon:yes stop_codon:yes gene_type:complete